MQVVTDSKNNIGYVEIVPNAKVAYSVEFDKVYVGDFDDQNNVVGIELLDAKTYKPGDLQKLMSRAKAEAVRQFGNGQPSETGKRSA
jgi:hypothetical protein